MRNIVVVRAIFEEVGSQVTEDLSRSHLRLVHHAALELIDRRAKLQVEPVIITRKDMIYQRAYRPLDPSSWIWSRYGSGKNAHSFAPSCKAARQTLLSGELGYRVAAFIGSTPGLDEDENIKVTSEGHRRTDVA